MSEDLKNLNLNSHEPIPDPYWEALRLTEDSSKVLNFNTDISGSRCAKDVALFDTDLQDLNLPPINWIYKDFISIPSLIAFSGSPGSYKTFFALHLSKQVADIPPKPLFLQYDIPSFFGMDVPKHSIPVLFIEEEMSLRQMKARSHLLGKPAFNLLHLIGNGLSFQNKKFIQETRELVIKNKIKLIILDPFSSLSGLDDENSNAQASKIMDILRQNFIADPLIEATVIFLHHPSKGDKTGKNLRGAGDILGKVDMHIHFEKINNAPRALVSYEKCRDVNIDEMEDFIIELRLNKPENNNLNTKTFSFVFVGRKEDVYQSSDNNNRQESNERLKLDILEALRSVPTGLTRKEVADIVGLSSNGTKFVTGWNELKDSGSFLIDPISKKFRLLVDNSFDKMK